ncbi:hypothetical protein AB0H34_15545 [Saccharopolyspora shandongensis]
MIAALVTDPPRERLALAASSGAWAPLLAAAAKHAGWSLGM